MNEVERIVICRTVGCANEGIPIELIAAPGTLVVCGVCGQIIEDVSSGDNEDVEVPPWLI